MTVEGQSSLLGLQVNHLLTVLCGCITLLYMFWSSAIPHLEYNSILSTYQHWFNDSGDTSVKAELQLQFANTDDIRLSKLRPIERQHAGANDSNTTITTTTTATVVIISPSVITPIVGGNGTVAEAYLQDELNNPRNVTVEAMLPQNDTLLLCPLVPPELVGPIKVWLDYPSYEELRILYPSVEAGGHSKPAKCKARHRVAIIIPYRNRDLHLRAFLHNIHAFLIKQQLDYAIFVVEQMEGQTFNRAKLMNVGYVEASKVYDWQCFIFHDVDLLPEDDRNLYTCPEQDKPRHMSVAIDRLKYRVGISGFNITRYPAELARYKMIKHTHEADNKLNHCRYFLMQKTSTRWNHDGLNNLRYELLGLEALPMFTKIRVDLLEAKSKNELKTAGLSCSYR